jgi:hypothetical protein
LVFRRAVIYLHFTKKAPSLHPHSKRAKVEQRGLPNSDLGDGSGLIQAMVSLGGLPRARTYLLPQW